VCSHTDLPLAGLVRQRAFHSQWDAHSDVRDAHYHFEPGTAAGLQLAFLSSRLLQTHPERRLPITP